jgi:hypothetical protein
MEKLFNVLKSEYQLDDVQTRLLELNCDIIKRLGFERILEKIEKDQRNRRDYMTELNLVGQLYRELGDSGTEFEMVYEEPNRMGAPDLKIVINDVQYWIQIKHLNEMKMEQINRKIVSEIHEVLALVPIGLNYDLHHSAYLDFEDVATINEIFSHILDITEGQTIRVDLPTNRHMTFDFFKMDQEILEHLTPAYTMGGVRMTSDERREQLTNSAYTAIHSINWRADEENVNLIAVEANHDVDPIDIGNVFYGDERDSRANGMDKGPVRETNGLMDEEEFQAKLSGYILLKNIRNEAITEYEKYLFLAKGKQLNQLCKAFSFDKVYNDRSWIE